MSDEYAKPGDTIMTEYAEPGYTILITDRKSTSFGKTFLVIECPDKYRHTVGCFAWVNLKYGPVAFLTSEYSVVSGQKNVDESLNRQRDDNLRRAFGF